MVRFLGICLRVYRLCYWQNLPSLSVYCNEDDYLYLVCVPVHEAVEGKLSVDGEKAFEGE